MLGARTQTGINTILDSFPHKQGKQHPESSLTTPAPESWTLLGFVKSWTTVILWNLVCFVCLEPPKAMGYRVKMTSNSCQKYPPVSLICQINPNNTLVPC